MKGVILSCPTLRKELQYVLGKYKSQIPVYYLPQYLHSVPDELKKYLQNIIDNMDNVERIYICVSGCGGGTKGLKATSAELVIPKTRDCLDVLLSGENLEDIKREKNGIFFTESWADFHKKSSLDLDKIIAAKGREAAEEYLRKLYKGFERFFIIDTGVYDTKEVEEYITPLVKILNGSITYVKGEYKILHKLAAGQIDDDFILVPKGETVSAKAWDRIK